MTIIKRKMRTKPFRVILIFTALMISSCIFAQDPPPPPTQGHGSGNNGVPGGGAPVGDGVLMLSVLAGSYLLRKIKSNYISNLKLKENENKK